MNRVYSSSTTLSQDRIELTNGLAPAHSVDSTRRRGLSLRRNKPEHRPISPKVDGKILEGIVPALALLILTVMMDLLIYPIQVAFHNNGLLVFFIVSLALGVFMLERSTRFSIDEGTRALSGMLAGLFFWHALWMVQLFASIDFASAGAVMILIIITLIGIPLWRPIFPLGVKFFLVSFLASWVNRAMVIYLQHTAENGLATFGLYYLAGFLAVVSVLICFGYLIFRAEFRIHRLWTALILWQTSMLSLSIILGVLI